MTSFFEETTGIANMVLLENCDEKKLIENLKKRLRKNIIYVRLFLIYYYKLLEIRRIYLIIIKIFDTDDNFNYL